MLYPSSTDAVLRLLLSKGMTVITM